MSPLTRSSICAVLLMWTFAGLAEPALSRQDQQKPRGSVSGRVTVGGQPAQGLVVALLSSESLRRQSPVAQAVTDTDGRFSVTNVVAGTYTVSPLTATMVVPANTPLLRPGRNITVAEGEAVEDVDFALERGGVITGQVTDASGQPVVGEHVTVAFHEEPKSVGRDRFFFNLFSSGGFETDDRGIYRVYGLPPGRYTVSVGESHDNDKGGFQFGNGYVPRTFHPDVTDEAKATVVEVRAGGEVTGVDIKLAPRMKAYSIRGRILEAKSGRPVPNVSVSYGPVLPKEVGMAAPDYGGRSNAKGEFRIEGILPGRYALFAGFERRFPSESVDNFYSDPFIVDVTDADLSGIDVRVKPSASIAGIVVLEGTTDRAVMARLPELTLAANVREQDAMRVPRYNGSKISPDGSFRIGGLISGKASLYLSGLPSSRKGFTVLRIERDGIEVPREIDIGQGEQLINLRVVVGYGTGVIRGEVKTESGQLSESGQLRVTAHRSGDDPRNIFYAAADERGRFTFEGLLAGTYEVTAMAYPVAPPGPNRRPPLRSNKQTVTISDGGVAEVTLQLETVKAPEGTR